MCKSIVLFLGRNKKLAMFTTSCSVIMHPNVVSLFASISLRSGGCGNSGILGKRHICTSKLKIELLTVEHLSQPFLDNQKEKV